MIRRRKRINYIKKYLDDKHTHHKKLKSLSPSTHFERFRQVLSLENQIVNKKTVGLDPKQIEKVNKFANTKQMHGIKIWQICKHTKIFVDTTVFDTNIQTNYISHG
jgi:hypothetical protein